MSHRDDVVSQWFISLAREQMRQSTLDGSFEWIWKALCTDKSFARAFLTSNTMTFDVQDDGAQDADRDDPELEPFIPHPRKWVREFKGRNTPSAHKVYARLLDGPLSALNLAHENRVFVKCTTVGLYTARTTLVDSSTGQPLNMKGLFCLFDLPADVLLGYYQSRDQKVGEVPGRRLPDPLQFGQRFPIKGPKGYDAIRHAYLTASTEDGGAGLTQFDEDGRETKAWKDADAKYQSYAFRLKVDGKEDWAVDPAMHFDGAHKLWKSGTLDFTNTWAVSATETRTSEVYNLLPFANEPPKNQKANITSTARTPKDSVNGDIVFHTCSDVQANRELFIHYGPKYYRTYPEESVGTACTDDPTSTQNIWLSISGRLDAEEGSEEPKPKPKTKKRKNSPVQLHKPFKRRKDDDDDDDDDGGGGGEDKDFWDDVGDADRVYMIPTLAFQGQGPVAVRWRSARSRLKSKGTNRWVQRSELRTGDKKADHRMRGGIIPNKSPKIVSPLVTRANNQNPPSGLYMSQISGEWRPGTWFVMYWEHE